MSIDGAIVLWFEVARWRVCFDTMAPLGRDGFPCPLWLTVEGEGWLGGAQRVVELQFGGEPLWQRQRDQIYIPEAGRIFAHVSASLGEVQALRDELKVTCFRRLNILFDKIDHSRVFGLTLGDSWNVNRPAIAGGHSV